MEKLGSDQILARGSRVIVFSRADMEGWEVRAFRRATILFRGERYFVAAKERRAGGFRYVLERRPAEADDDLGGAVIEYGAPFVAERDAARTARVAATGVQVFLLPIYPLIGLLPSAVKRRLADRFGVSEERATAMSLWLELMTMFALGALLSIKSVAGVYGQGLGVRGGIPWLEDLGGFAAIALALIAPDLLVRYSRILAEDPRAYGFWEWLFRWRR